MKEAGNRLSSLMPRGPDGGAAASGRRRRTQRVPFRARVSVLEPVQAAGSGIDASCSGLRATFDEPLEVGARCLLLVDLAGKPSFFEPVRVVWVEPDGGAFVTGLEFLTGPG